MGPEVVVMRIVSVVCRRIQADVPEKLPVLSSPTLGDCMPVRPRTQISSRHSLSSTHHVLLANNTNAFNRDDAKCTSAALVRHKLRSLVSFFFFLLIINHYHIFVYWSLLRPFCSLPSGKNPSFAGHASDRIAPAAQLRWVYHSLVH